MSRNIVRPIVVVLLTLMSIPAALLAQEAPAAPATMPAAGAATQPAVPADSTTPKGTLTLLSRATESGDTSAVRGLLNVTNPTEQKLADVLMQRTEVYAAFRKAAVKSFGEDAANQLTGNTAADAAESESRIQQADVKIDNNKATAAMEGQPVNLIKVGDKWKLSLETLTAEMPAGDVDQKLQQIKMLSDVVKQTTGEINQGKFKSPEEVNDAIRAKLASVMLQAPATGPATAPAVQQ